VSLPDFVIIGAMKCATSTLATQLALQEGIFLTDPKEPNFFSDDAVHARGLDWYARLFDPARPGDLKGEASTHYTKLPTHPQTLARLKPVLPETRIIYMIRNPMDRALSHIVHEWSRGHLGRNADEAVGRAPEIVEYGRYAMQVAPWIEAYGSEAVLLTSLEQLKADPQGEMARIGAHLNLPDIVWQTEIAAQNVSADRVRRLPFHGLIVDNALATGLRRVLMPKSVRAFIRKRRTIGDRPAFGPEARRQLEETYLADRAMLAAFFPGHPVLDLAYPFAGSSSV